MKLLSRWVTSLAVITLDRIGALTKEQCRAFGGMNLNMIRVCTKWRWHTDSHSYEWREWL